MQSFFPAIRRQRDIELQIPNFFNNICKSQFRSDSHGYNVIHCRSTNLLKNLDLTKEEKLRVSNWYTKRICIIQILLASHTLTNDVVDDISRCNI